MTRQRKLLILVLILIAVSAVIGWFILPVFKSYLYYSRLDSEGLTADGEIVEKEIQDASRLLRIFDPSSVNHVIRVKFKDLGGNTRQSVLGVSKLFYDGHNVGDVVQVQYLKDDLERCEAAAFVEGTRHISKIVSIMGFVVWVTIVLVPGVIGFTLIKRTEGTEGLKLNTSEMRCPECGSFMEEGYVPLISGINWRRKGQPVGMLTVFSGLPGTVWWNPFNRPKLPGFHCPRCKVILLKYAK